MTCHNCNSRCKKQGKDRKGHQRFRCRQCSKTFTEPHNGHIAGMYLSPEKAASILTLSSDPGVSPRRHSRCYRPMALAI